MQRMINEKRYTVIDLFAGCGGLSLGLYQSGWDGLFAIEKNSFAFATLKANLIDNKKHFNWPDWLPQTPHDINEVLKKYTPQLKNLRGTVDLVAGGPPCQGFSMAGKRVEEGLKRVGYNVKPHIIDFSKYGVPQRRNRFILVGVQKTIGSPDSFESLLESVKDVFLQSKGISSSTTVKDAISDLLQSNGEIPTPDRKGFKSGLYGSVESNYQILLRGTYPEEQHVPDSHSFAKHTMEKTECFRNLLANYSIRGKRVDGDARIKWNVKQRSITILNENSISPTITGHPDDYLHYCEPRIMTVRECARIQSFPDWYEIKMKYTTGGNMRKVEVPRYTQIGNAIPPLFAELAGIVLKNMI